MLHLAGHGEKASEPPTKVRTVSAQTAVSHAKRLTSELIFSPMADDVVFKVRNAALHMALVDSEELRQAITVMVRIVGQLLSVSPWPDRATFWGDELLKVADE